MRKPLLAGNWKMYKTPADTKAFFEKFVPLVAGASHADVAICPPFVAIAAAVDGAAGSHIGIGGQDCYWTNKEGAFTGEVSPAMLKAAGCQWVIIGHSERRQFFGETDESVCKKTVAAIEAGLKPIVCVGELLEERESGRTNDVLKTQFDGGIAPLTAEQFAQIVIAYEPVWAIGTGKNATPDDANRVHQFIRGLISGLYGEKRAERMLILYGGSMKPENAGELLGRPHIDGGLIGGASIVADSFIRIIRAGL